MATKTEDHFNQHGALVGWTHEDLGDRVMVCMQSQRSRADDDVDTVQYLMTKNQAVVLANYLFKISGRLPAPPRKKRWFG